MRLNINQQAFIALVKAGLWEKEARLSQFEHLDFKEILRIAEEQSVVGLVAAGLEHVVDVKLPKVDVLRFVGQALQLEQQNVAMNLFIGEIIDKLRKYGVYAILIKGQGVAQCYEKPLWRSCGDVDLLLSEENYRKAKAILLPLSTTFENEYEEEKHQGMVIGPWAIELHGTLRCGLSLRMDRVIDESQKNVFLRGNVRSWMNERSQVFLPGVDDDLIFIFTHYLKHFYRGGIGLRQICDWSRLLWTYHTEVDANLLEQRLKKMGLVSEWKAFGAFAVDFLGIPADAMPFYDKSKCWKRKAVMILTFILKSGNFGHNRDNTYSRYPFLIRKAGSFGRRIGDLFGHARIFPFDSLRFLPSIVFNGLRVAMKGE